MIEREDRGDIAIVRLAHGPVNALDIELIEAITTTFGELGVEEYRAVVLTGSGSAFSAGVDLRRFAAGGADYVNRFLSTLDSVFDVVFRHPTPVIAAINGHAIAGGCVLAAACDRRLLAAGRAQVGVPELVVGVPFPTAALEVMRFVLGTPTLARVLGDATTYGPDDALALGLVDEVIESAEPPGLVDRAVTLADELSGGRIPAPTYRLTKRQLRRATIEAIDRARPLDHERVVERWLDPGTTDWIAAYLERVTGRS